MDPAQGESGGGRSLTSKLKTKVPHTRVKDKVKNLKNRLPGMKKHGGDVGAHEDSSEYDDTSPTGTEPETGYNNVGESTSFSSVKATPDSNSPRSYERLPPREVHNPEDDDYNSRPAQSGYDAQNRNYVAAAPPTRPAPLATDSPRSNLAPAALEEKFQHLDVGEKPRDDAPDRSSQSEQPQPPSPSKTEVCSEISFSMVSAAQSVEKGYSDAPSNSSSETEGIQKGFNDATNNSYRSNTSAPTTPTSKGMLEKVKETVAGATGVLGDKMGYYNDHVPSPRDPNAPTILEKAKSALGVDKPRDPNAPPLAERAKAYMSVASQKTREYSATTADRAAWTKDRVAAQATPTHHDKALSEQVTQSLSNLPGAIKEKIFGPASPSTPGRNPPASPRIVDRVSGAVSSLFTTASPKQTGEHVHHAFPDAAPSAPPPCADRSSAQETMPATTVNN